MKRRLRIQTQNIVAILLELCYTNFHVSIVIMNLNSREGSLIEEFCVASAPVHFNMSCQNTREIVEKLYPLSPPLAYLHCFGCQQNVSDGEKLRGILSLMGYGFTEDLNAADLILFNTCAVRENAEKRVFGVIGQLKHLKKMKPGLVICLCGCMAQQPHVVEKIKQSYRMVDIVFGTFAMEHFPVLLYEVLEKRKKVYDISQEDLSMHEEIESIRTCQYKASVPIMYGCNNFCTYCIVPYVRGRERSRQPENILKEIEELAANGCKEILLLGQNVNSYGKRITDAKGNPVTFTDLLEKIDAIPGDFRVRFMTSHPKDASKKLIDVIWNSKKICKHLHLPVQSGSNRILTAMNRHYTREQYMEIIQYARSYDSEFSFTTDIIVGFPGETREDFLQTLSLLEEVRYDNIYSFIYSRRTGTKAAGFEDITSAEEKSKWMQELLVCQREIAHMRNQRYIGQTLPVLFDLIPQTGRLRGRSDDNIIVECAGPSELLGQFASVKIQEAYNWAVSGQLSDQSVSAFR